MAFFIGTDEAGYGPNLGPLVIAATAWQAPDSLLDADLYSVLETSVSRTALRSNARTVRVPLADSKKLYTSGETLAQLELGLFACLAACRPGAVPLAWRDIWSRFDPSCVSQIQAEPWFRDYQESLPVDLTAETLEAGRRTLDEGLRTSGVAIRDMQARVVFPGPFNDLVDQQGNKGSALSHVTLQLVRDLLGACDRGPILIQCDKHGGRNRYGALLQQAFPDYLIEVREEGPALSVYRWGPADRRVEIRFAAKGENFLPSALASMIAKYLRELAMRAFNGFWIRELPGLAPTAGYPVDAVRFRKQIEPRQRELAIDDHMLWRKR